ncbi:MAG: transporter substrate-binding domain-containing protein [Gammaproteobacteria bacterium]|jgi:ABC-type amino acid transport substrate-binding protein
MLVVLAFVAVVSPQLRAQITDAGVTDSTFTVAVREVPPFAMRDESGEWRGLSVDLWREVAEAVGIDYELREADLEVTLDLLRNREIDAAITAISATSAREASIDFSHPYYVTGLGQAFATQRSSAWVQTLRRFFSLEFLSALGSLALVLLAAGFLIWLFERRVNAEEFGHGDVARGLGDGFWWSAVTMTTVGYGDKAPKTLGGRLVALVWMFLSLIIIASFTASIAASLTTGELIESQLRDRPLSELDVGVLEGSAAEEFVRTRGAVPVSFDSVSAALGALSAGTVDTVIHDEPILRYEIRAAQIPVDLSLRVLARDDYAFALQEGSPQRNAINVALLGLLDERRWQDIRARYLGDVDE